MTLVQSNPNQYPHPPGWYMDPINNHTMRKWDGTKWTDDTAPTKNRSQQEAKQQETNDEQTPTNDPIA